MKKKLSIFLAGSLCLVVISGLLGSACFSTMNASGMGHATVGSTAASAAADVVTLPVQLPFFIIGGAEAASRQSANSQVAAAKAKALAAIKKDPSVVLSWNFDPNMGTPEYEAFITALQDPSIKFTDEVLHELVQRSPLLGEAILSHPVASETFIRLIFADEMAKELQGEPSALRTLIQNQHMPDDLLIEVIQKTPRYNFVVFNRRNVSEPVIRAAFEGEMQKDLQGETSAFDDIIRSPQMPDDLLIEVIQKTPKHISEVFNRRNISEAVIRAAFEDELRKDKLNEPSAINDMIRAPNMPTDLLTRVAEADLPNSLDDIMARNELYRRAAASP